MSRSASMVPLLNQKRAPTLSVVSARFSVKQRIELRLALPIGIYR
jgi:hypothetical protein